jgi:hypothetical protein
MHTLRPSCVNVAQFSLHWPGIFLFPLLGPLVHLEVVNDNLTLNRHTRPLQIPNIHLLDLALRDDMNPLIPTITHRTKTMEQLHPISKQHRRVQQGSFFGKFRYQAPGVQVLEGARLDTVCAAGECRGACFVCEELVNGNGCGEEVDTDDAEGHARTRKAYSELEAKWTGCILSACCTAGFPHLFLPPQMSTSTFSLVFSPSAPLVTPLPFVTPFCTSDFLPIVPS